MRGTAWRGPLPQQHGRFIPADAGNGREAMGERWLCAVYPRGCGERLFQRLSGFVLLGLSPRMRGTAVPIRTPRLHSRFIPADADRKSTRLNSSHVKISYAVFCLIKKITALY